MDKHGEVHEREAMLKCYQIVEGRLAETGDSAAAQVLVYINPDDTEKAYLVNTLLLDEHTLNSSLDAEELGRLEFETNHVAAIIKRPKRYDAQHNFFFKVSSLGLFLFSEQLIIVTSDDDLGWEGRIFTKIQTVKDVFLKTIFGCVYHFEGHLKVIRKMSEELEAVVNRALSNKDLLHLFQLEKSLVYYLDAINSNNKVIEKIRSSAVKLLLSQEASEFVDDLYIEGAQCYQQADTYSEVLSSMMDARASIINNNLNIRLKTLTLVSICIMMPTFVVSLFSMNVPLPIAQHDTLSSFWLVVALAAASVATILLIWYYRKW